MTCNCVEEFNAKLADHNTRIVQTLGFPRDGSPAFTRPKIVTEKIETRKRVGPVIAVPSYCPFCGKAYPGYGAPQQTVATEELGDLRQGVTPAGHAVFDCLEAKQTKWRTMYDVDHQLIIAMNCIRDARSGPTHSFQRQKAIEAAARLINAVDKLRLTGSEGDL